MSVLREYSCRFDSAEAGHMGVNLIGLVRMSISEAGVSDGIQKDGSDDFASAYLKTFTG